MKEQIIIQTRTEYESGQVTTVTAGPFFPPCFDGEGEPTNEERAERSRCAIAAYGAIKGEVADGPETFAADLLADLLHMVGGESADFDLDRALRCARGNYLEEAAE